MAEYKWPEADKRSLIGKRISRIDGPHKVSGRAKYSYDVKRPGVLYARMLRSPARARQDRRYRYQRRGEDARRESGAHRRNLERKPTLRD